MRPLLLAFALVLAGTVSVKAKDAEPIVLDFAHGGAFATEQRVLEHEFKLSGDFAVRDAAGKDLPVSYDKKAGKILILAGVPAGGGKFTLHQGVKSKAKLPVWKKHKLETEKQQIDLGKKVKRVTAELQSDVLKLELPAEKTIHGRIELSSIKGNWKLALSPLGASVGCVETAAMGEAVNESYQKGEPSHPEVFVVYPSIATKATVLEPNPFQRTLRVETFVYARKNSDRKLDLFDDTGFEVTLTWGSPIVTIHAWRKLKTTFFNHNGVNLNEIYLDAMPIQLQCDAEAEARELKLQPGAKVAPFEFERTLWMRDKTGACVIHQPDFKRLGVYKPCTVAAADRIMTVISQSWHEGWKAIEIKAGDYSDTMTVACNVGDSEKKLKDWIAELEPAPKGE